MKDQDILSNFNRAKNSQNVLQNLKEICEKHYINYHNNNINRMLQDGHINIGNKKFSCPLKYIEHEVKANMPKFISEKNINAAFTKIYEEIKSYI